MISRRNFLQLGGAAALMMGVGGNTSRLLAQKKHKNLIVVFAFGGWDPTIVFDPKPGSEFVDMTPGQMTRYGDANIWTHDSRPNIKAFFDTWSSMSVTINGIPARSLVHEECVEQILTGASTEVKPDFAAVIASKTGIDRPIPYLTFGSHAKPADLAHLAGEVGFTNQLPSLAVPELAYPHANPEYPNQGLTMSAAEASIVDRILNRSQSGIAGTRGRNKARLEALKDASTRAKRLEAFLNQSELSSPSVVYRFSERAKFAVQALKEQLSKSVYLQVNGWDTHSGVDQQLGMFDELFGGLNTLLTDLHTESLLEDTTVVVLSEMGRTPRRNKQEGKDHWPFTSAMVIDTAIRGNRSIGASDEYVMPKKINFQNGLGDESGELLRMPNIIAAITQLVGLSPAELMPEDKVFNALVS